MKRRLAPGRSGFARHSEDPNKAYWLENMVITEDGYYRPRYGLKHCKTMAAGEINHLSRPGGYNARIMLIGESGNLYNLHVETGVATLVATGWPTGPVAASVGNVPGAATRWLACKGTISGASGPVYHYDLTTLTELVSTAPSDGNFLGMMMGAAFRVISGDGTQQALQWSKVNDVTTWDTLYQHPPPCGLRSVDTVWPFGPREGILLGPNGVVRVTGVLPRNIAFESLAEMEIATPMFHPIRARDRLFFAGAGPKLYQLTQGGGAPVPIEPPLFRDLFLAAGTSKLRGWYDGVLDEAVIWDRTQKLGYRYSLRQNAFVGVLTFGDPTKQMLGCAVIDQGASTVDEATQPWAKAFFAVDNLVLQSDPSVATDATSSSTTSAFTCKVESQPMRGVDPAYERQLNSLQIHAVGSWTPYFKYRQGPDDAWTTVTAGAPISCPGRWHVPLSSVKYRELVVGVSASSSSTLRFHSFELDELIVGLP
ncbi:MAG: hypothetical protein ACH37Z_12195 [Anaerolineae bacterium]